MDGGLLVNLITALGAALVGAVLAALLRQPIIIGYIAAGIAIGPFTPGIIGDSAAIAALAELGIVFLMFAIGAQLSLSELVQASRIAVLGGLAQVAIMGGIGYAIGRALGWGPAEAYAIGAVLSNSSSTVLSRVLDERGELDSSHARLALAWSSVQDVSTVALVAGLALMSPAARSPAALIGTAALFFLVLVPLAFWVLPWLLRRATGLGNRELFSVAVITVALGMAGAASLLGVSLALGAFLAGIVVGESDLAHRILGDAIPLRDVFSGIFFVSIGMLVDPAFVADAWGLVLLMVALIVVVKGVVTAGLARAVGCSMRVAVLVGAALAQCGEFSFLLARIGFEDGLVPASTFNLLLSAAAISIVLSPAVNALVPGVLRRLQQSPRGTGALQPGDARLRDHAIVCGYGRVGSIVCELLEAHAKPFVVIEEDLRLVDALQQRGVPALFGDAAQPYVLERAHLRTARLLILCFPERMAARRAVEYARESTAGLTILARTHTREDRRVLQAHGVDEAVLGELELALEIGRRALERLGIAAADAERTIDAARAHPASDQ